MDRSGRGADGENAIGVLLALVRVDVFPLIRAVPGGEDIGGERRRGRVETIGLARPCDQAVRRIRVGTQRGKNGLGAGIVDRCVEARARTQKMAERIVQRRRKRLARGRRLKDGVPEIRHLVFLRILVDSLRPDEFAARRFVFGHEVVPLTAAGEGGAATFARAAEQAGQFGAVAGPRGKQFAAPDDKAIHLRVDARHGAAMDHADDDALGFLIRTDKFAFAYFLQVVPKVREHRAPLLAFSRERPLDGRLGGRRCAGVVHPKWPFAFKSRCVFISAAFQSTAFFIPRRLRTAVRRNGLLRSAEGSSTQRNRDGRAKVSSTLHLGEDCFGYVPICAC
jgi:hypothetical protein